MIAFVVSVNGQRVSTIGVGDNGLLDATVYWSGRPPRQPDDLQLSFGGIDSSTDEHVRWPWPPQIKVGDTVSFEVVETDVVDPPRERKTPAQIAEDDRALRAKLAASRQIADDDPAFPPR
jgi:hypothetical protein